MTDREPTPVVVNIDADHDASLSGEDDDGGRYVRLGRASGGTHLGCTLEDIQPGGRPSKFHYHLANEEALYVVHGRGTLRTPDGDQAISAGDYVAFPVGEAGAHAVENTSDDLLRCLFVSTMREPDVTVYPDERQLYVGGLRKTVRFEADPTDG